MSSITPRANYMDGPAIMQKASEILANNSKFLNTPLDMSKADPWPTAYTRPSSRTAAQAPLRIRSSTCSPTRGTRQTNPALSDEFQSQLEEVMKGAQKYRRPASAHSRVMQSQHQGRHAPPPYPPLSHNTAALTHSSYAQPFPRPPSHSSLASHMQHAAHSNFPSAPQSHASHGTAHHSQHGGMPAPDALALVDSGGAASHSQDQQLRKLYYDVQRGQSMLQQEQQETERLRRTVRERDNAVHDARAHARSATRQLEEEVDRRVAAEKRVADVQRVLQTEQDERKRAEDRARDARALVRTLEQQLSRREPSQREDSASLRWELEAKCSQVGALEERLRGAQASLDARSNSLAEAQASLQRSRAEVEELHRRLVASTAAAAARVPDAAAPDDAEVVGLQAEISRLNAALQERRSGSGVASATPGDGGLELLQLRCLLEAKERELSDVRGELAAARSEAGTASGAGQEQGGATEAVQRQVDEVMEQRRAAERRAAEAEGAKVLLNAECAALREQVERLRAHTEGPEQAPHAGAAMARPGTPAAGSRRPAAKAPPGADGDTGLTVRTAGSNTSAHSWRIEAAGAGGSPPHGGAAAAAEAARLREELATAHQLHADLELSSGETMQVLQQQVRELESQLASERQPGTSAAQHRSSESGGSGDGAAAAEWRRKHDALLSRHHQLQQQLLAVRDIHGIDMPLLAGDAAVEAPPESAPTAAAVQATLAAVQARQDEAERRMAEVLQRREAAERARSAEWQRRVDALSSQVKGLEADLATAQQPADRASGEEVMSLKTDAEALREAKSLLEDELTAVRADLEALHSAQEAAQARAAAAEASAATAQEAVSAALGEAAEAELRIAAAEGRAAAARADATSLQVEVEALRQQLECAEERLRAPRGPDEGAAVAAGAARAAQEECERLRWEMEGLRSSLAAARSAASVAGAVVTEDPTGLDGQVRTLREEVLRLKMELEGSSAAAEEAEGLRGQLAEARREAEDMQQQLQAEAEEARWCWRQVDELTAESAALRERLKGSEAGGGSAEAEEEAAGLRQELARMQEQLRAAEGLQVELGELRRRLAAAEDAAAGGEEVRARARALEGELDAAQADLREAQGALVAAAQAPAELQEAAEEVWGRTLCALRQGIAEALPDDLAAQEAAQAGRDEELARAVAAAVKRQGGGADAAAAAKLAAAEEAGRALQREVARLQTHRKQLEAQAFEAENSLFEVEKELQAALDGKAAADTQRHEADRLAEQLRQELRQAAAAVPTAPAGDGASADARVAAAERRAAAAEDEAAALELTLKEAEQNLSNAFQDIEQLRGQRGAPDASAADARRCARVAEAALEAERAKVVDLQRQVAALEKEVASLKATVANSTAAAAAAGRRSRAPQRMRPYTPTPVSPAPQPPVHSEHDSSHSLAVAPRIAPEASTGSVEAGHTSPTAAASVELAPHRTAVPEGGGTPPWEPLQAQAAAATAQSRAAGAQRERMHAADGGSAPSGAAVAASLADLQGPGGPEAEVSLVEAASPKLAGAEDLADPYSHLSLLTPPGPLLADSSESQRSLSSRHAQPSPLQLTGHTGVGGGAAHGGGHPVGLGGRSPHADSAEHLDGRGSSASSGPLLPGPGVSLSPVVGGPGTVGSHGSRRLARRAVDDVDDSTSQWGVTGMGSLENVIDFLGKGEDGQNGESVNLSPAGGHDTAQSATPAAAVQR